MKDNVIRSKSYSFSLKIIDLYKFLSTDRHEYVMSKQILRCGTSIGANIEESIGAQSKRDFLNKISISYKEARETIYWLRLLLEAQYITSELYEDLYKDCETLLKIIGKIQITTKKNLSNS